MKKTIIILLLIFLFSTIYSDVFSDWKKQQNEAFKAYKQDEDRAFRDFLEKEWKEFKVFKGIVQDETPKIEEPPVSNNLSSFNFNMESLFKWLQKKTEKEEAVLVEENQSETQENEIMGSPDTMSKESGTSQTDISKTEVDAETDKSVQIKTVVSENSQKKLDYFGSEVIIPTDRSMEIGISVISESSIASFWREISSSSYSGSLEALKRTRDRYSLNDWGYAVQVHRFTESLYNGGDWNSKLLTWFLLTKSGISARVAYKDNDIYLMIPSSNTLYGHPFFTIDNTNYYIISFEEELGTIPPLYTYQGEYSGVDIMEMELEELPSLHEQQGKRRLTFIYKENNYSFYIEYEKQIVDFLERYPHTDNFIYFEGGISEVFSNSIKKAFFPILQGKSEAEAVNLILRFVQTAFEYQTDEIQFGREKWLFPDETIYYPYADCEDRSILFAWMVKNLTDLDVVGLDWPGHIATAVAFKDNIPGDYININGKRYTVCDPTYINADIGMMMENYRGVGFKVIEIE
jgi:hypothetical protein